MRNGLFDSVPDRSKLIVKGKNAWDTPAFYEAGTGKVVTDVVSAAEATSVLSPPGRGVRDSRGWTSYTVGAAEPVYWVEYLGLWPGNGYAAVGKVRNVIVSPLGQVSVGLEPVVMFAAAAPQPVKEVQLSMWPLDGFTSATADALGASAAEVLSKATGPDWAVFVSKPGVSITRASDQ
jgi:hypothetical protein